MGDGSEQDRRGLEQPAHSRQAERAEQTRALLLQAAETIFARDGFEAARIEEIAAEAGRTRGAFYANFESKADVFLALRSQMVKSRAMEIRERVNNLRPGETASEAIQQFLVEQVCEAQTLVLQIEFKLFALRHPEMLEELAERHLDASSAVNKEELAMLFPEASRARDMMRRDTLAIEAVLEGFGLNYMFSPKALDAAYLQGLIPELLAHVLPKA